MTSTCAGYDDDAQICCGHGGEGGQNVSLTAEVHEQGLLVVVVEPDRCSFSFFVCAPHSSYFIHFPSSIGFHFSRRQLLKAGGGWREPPAVACSSRNAA